MKDLATICENIPDSMRLTCIIPVRLTRDRTSVIERLDFSLMDTQRPDDVGFLVLDDGSDSASAEEIRQACRRNGFGYLRLDTENIEFSVGRCRNYGAMYARSKYILFQDVDLMPYDGLYRNILNEITVQDLDRNAQDFLMFGFVFLTEEATREYFATEEGLRRQKFLNYALINDASKIEKLSTGTSATLFNREYYLARGGNSPDFEGWGYEDLEFHTRCVRLSHRFPVPRDWLVDRKNFTTIIDFSGWKASYRLYGDTTFNKGMTFFHAWHPVNNKSDYMQAKEKNRLLFTSKMADFVKFGAEPEPLPSKMEGRTLLFRSNPFVFHREIRPRLGDTILVQEDMFASADEFETFVRDQEITRVMFFNPYQNEKMEQFYRRCRETDIPLVVAERGALRNSLFFDHSGFLGDGTSYDRSRWDRPLTQSERDDTLAYISRERSTDSCLETQGKRITAQKLRTSLGIPAHKKVLFLTLQRPGDSVTRFMAGPMETYDNFIALAQDVAKKLPWDWVMVVKKHPLEDESPAFEGAITAHQANIKDLLDLSDAVLTLNSGTGVLAMLWDKPVFYAGKAFYGHDGINLQVTRSAQLMEAIKSGFRPDRETTLRFLNYLVHEFYSFGEFSTKPVKLGDGSNMTATTNIRFEMIRGLGQHATPYLNRKKSQVTWESSLFDRYRHAEQQHIAASKSSSVPAAKAKPSPQAEKAATPALPGQKAATPVQPVQIASTATHAAQVMQHRGTPFQRKMKKLVHSPRRFFADMRIVRTVVGA